MIATPIFDTCIAQTEDGPYGPGNFEEQLRWKVATVADLQERATQALLDKGWEPNHYGILIAPTLRKRLKTEVTKNQPTKKATAKKTAARKTPSSDIQEN